MKTIRVALCNTNRILGKKHGLQYYIHKEELHLVLLSEIHIKTCYKLNVFNFITYKTDRTRKKRVTE